MEKHWFVQDRTEDDLLTQLLVNRGVIDRAAFLSPDYQQLHRPDLLKNLDQAIDRIEQAIAKNELIGIFGDYDHDGTPAAALLAEGITRCGGTIGLVYIPSRDEGYGLSDSAVDVMAKANIKLLITVDCGITNKPEIDREARLGLATIVIDHHHVQVDKFPDSATVINPKQAGDHYPFKELCACGLAFKVVQALGQATAKIDPGELKWFLDLVAIATVCDMVPLVDENRLLVHFGLLVLAKTKRIGLQELYRVAEIDPKTITPYTVGFGIGPRLNAPGRMAQASLAADLLMATDRQSAHQLAQQLNQYNHQRQAELAKTLAEAEERIVAEGLANKKIILVTGDDWPDGVVGLVAGRLMEKYHRPTFVLSNRTDGLAKGSARSIDGFHLVEALNLAEAYLVKYGGHAKAAGLTLEQGQLTSLYDKLIETADRLLTADHLAPRIMIDAKLRPAEASLKTVEKLTQLEPYGLGNPRPVFLLEQAKLDQVRLIGSGKHLKLSFILADQKSLDAVGFSLASRQAELQRGAEYDLVGGLEKNEWQGRLSLQFKLTDWRSAAKP